MRQSRFWARWGNHLRRYDPASWFLLLLGAFLYAGGINAFVVSNHLAEGGVSGITILIHYLLGGNLGLLYLILNIPLLIFGWWQLGWSFTIRTTFGAMATSLALSATTFLSFPLDDLLLASLYAGGIMGLGIGLMFRSGGSSAGFDIIARFVKERWGFSITETYLVLDAMVLTAAALVLGANGALYSLIITVLTGRVADLVQEGPLRGKAVFIISEQYKELASWITNVLDRGATRLHATGVYTDQQRNLIITIVNRRQLAALKTYIQQLDPDAFVFITDVSEVMGEGFAQSLQQAKKSRNREQE